MFFNLFGKKENPDHLFIDISFMSAEAKDKAVMQCAEEKADRVFIGWFSETVSHFKNLFSENGLDENKVIDAKAFSSLKYPDMEIVFLEHHPLKAKEDRFTEKIKQEGFRVFNSITEPFFQYFGGEKVTSLMKKMGMAEGESIIHPFISSSVKNAQKKLAKKILSEESAPSQAEWMKRNIKN